VDGWLSDSTLNTLGLPSGGSGPANWVTRVIPSDSQSGTNGRGRLLITAGPTHEPIDAVRYIANRSSGQLGVALAEEAAQRGWRVILLLGPTNTAPTLPGVRLIRFQSTADLESALIEHLSWCDVLIMAAAVADYRPIISESDLETKCRRTTDKMVIELSPTPDLLAGCADRRRDDQTIVGFALEPRAEMIESARRKLTRKKIDMVVANPLETMDSDQIEATILGREGTGLEAGRSTPGAIAKTEFAGWLLGVLEETACAPRR